MSVVAVRVRGCGACPWLRCMSIIAVRVRGCGACPWLQCVSMVVVHTYTDVMVNQLYLKQSKQKCAATGVVAESPCWLYLYTKQSNFSEENGQQCKLCTSSSINH